VRDVPSDLFGRQPQGGENFSGRHGQFGLMIELKLSTTTSPTRARVASTAASTALDAASSERHIDTAIVSVTTRSPPPLVGGGSSSAGSSGWIRSGGSHNPSRLGMRGGSSRSIEW
jgi:hypothetical protein